MVSRGRTLEGLLGSRTESCGEKSEAKRMDPTTARGVPRIETSAPRRAIAILGVGATHRRDDWLTFGNESTQRIVERRHQRRSLAAEDAVSRPRRDLARLRTGAGL